MPIARYDAAYGGKKGAAQEALSSMIRQYGQKKGTSVFYATANRNKKKRKGKLSRALRSGA
jgi:hypothetical protein